MSRVSSTSPEISEQAARWAARLHENSLHGGELSEEQRKDLQRWLVSDARHYAEFRAHNVLLAIATASTLYEDLKSDRRAPSRTVMRKPAQIWAVAAVLVVLAVGLLLWFSLRDGSVIYATRTGETRTVEFEDGVLAYLNTRTRLQWLGDDGHTRHAALLEGEALFDVPPDAVRPFVLDVGVADVRVLGTRFNVYRRPNGIVTVTVLQGAVVVSTHAGNGSGTGWNRELRENQRLEFGRATVMPEIRTAGYREVASWRSGSIVVSEVSLAELLAELSRYTDKRIVIRDPRIASIHVGGAFSVRDPGVFLHRLSVLNPHLVVTETAHAIFVDYRDEVTE